MVAKSDRKETRTDATAERSALAEMPPDRGWGGRTLEEAGKDQEWYRAIADFLV